MPIIQVTSMNRGINVQQDPAAIPDGFVADCFGFDMVPEGRLDTAGGIALGDLGAYLPDDDIQWADIFYIETTRYVLATTSDGLYSNGTKVNNLFTGRFKGASLTGNIYLTNGVYSIRFDGSGTYRWGIEYPTTNPTISTGSGTSSLNGDYYFIYTWCRNDALGNTIHESSPTRVLDVMQVIGPVTFAGEGIHYSDRPLSSDPQVNGANLYAINVSGNDLSDYWLIYSWTDNTTASGALPDGTGVDTATRILTSLYNYPAPAGQDVELYWNKIWMVGITGQVNVLRTSDILSDGTLAPEGWPPRNGYELDGNNGALLNIDILNTKLSVKGEFGEWQVDKTDPTDYLQTRSHQISAYGLASQDGIVRLPTSHIYPSKNGFVETNGNNAQFIFPELTPLIDSYVGFSFGVNAGLVSYFSYKTVDYGERTAKIDLFSGQNRFSNLSNVLFTQMFYDKKLGKVYGILDGEVALVDVGSTNEFDPQSEIQAFLKRKTYQLPRPNVWSWISFQHNTGGVWYKLKVYVDDVLVAMFPFRSITRTLDYFRFGPSSGIALYFTIEGNFTVSGSLFLPVRICHGGE